MAGVRRLPPSISVTCTVAAICCLHFQCIDALCFGWQWWLVGLQAEVDYIQSAVAASSGSNGGPFGAPS
jgi:hypothetical protein